MKKLSIRELFSLTLEELKEEELLTSIELMTTHFTVKREKIEEYVLSPKQVSSYMLFYMPTNLPKLEFLYDELFRQNGLDFFKNLTELEFVDIGCGPGTFSLGHLLYLKKLGLEVQKICLVDTSHLMLLQAQKVIKHFFPNVSIRTEKNLNFHKNAKALYFFGHSLNEMNMQEIQSLFNEIDQLNQNEMIFWIEPGTSLFFKKAVELRENLINKKWNVLYPCPSLLSCPLRNSENDWCHQIVRCTHEDDVERISQKVKLDRKILPMNAFVFSKRDSENMVKFFPVRFLQETKFSFDFTMCLEADSANILVKAELLKRKLDKAQMKTLKQASLGRAFLNKNLEKQVKDYRIRDDLIRIDHNYE